MAYSIPQLAVYTTYILPSGGLYATYHLLGEPETTIDIYQERWGIFHGYGSLPEGTSFLTAASVLFFCPVFSF